ncbi:hypothetical protein HMI01_25970 [Halolactibacillus miurensis]|uniref:Uncharacterized protein n=1 Tax=Halolactibacillus miurensis TaxID=306541 RepID=A0A1I6UU37_9BACI|nr:MULTISPECIES: hypothetical protein [Halolactibacillus]GEM05609.1 hypothetical protein HMI01_25970 [Halolactibacillus miurensis]SFT04834.1 hypothetical protein SAMN05421668_13331 [Halolactibacillus miurensis]
MFIESSKARGNHYCYVKKYVPVQRMKYRETLYSLGKIEDALKELEHWENDLNHVPKIVLSEGITHNQIKKWRMKLNEKLHKMERGASVNKSKMII